MNNGFIAKASIRINAPVAKVWNALITPSVIKKYMFGTEVVSDWKKDSRIVWKGIWKNKPYEDKGVIHKIVPEKILEYSHFSPLSGLPDLPENYHKLTYEISNERGQTNVSLMQDNNATEKDMHHSEEMWKKLLTELKKLLEK